MPLEKNKYRLDFLKFNLKEGKKEQYYILSSGILLFFYVE